MSFFSEDSVSGSGPNFRQRTIKYVSQNDGIVIRNDKGRNAYFQADYTTTLNEFTVDMFIGTAKGSPDNPGYYGTDKFSVINTGFKVSKSITITDNFSLPVYFSYIVNPNTGLVFFVLGLSI